MHPNPAFRKEPDEINLGFARDRSWAATQPRASTRGILGVVEQRVDAERVLH